MRISDWSSDVCSSDLINRYGARRDLLDEEGERALPLALGLKRVGKGSDLVECSVGKIVDPDDIAGVRSADRTRSKMIADFESANFTEMVARPHFAAGDAFDCEKMRGSNPSRSEEGALILEFCPGRLAEQKAGTDRSEEHTSELQ